MSAEDREDEAPPSQLLAESQDSSRQHDTIPMDGEEAGLPNEIAPVDREETDLPSENLAGPQVAHFVIPRKPLASKPAGGPSALQRSGPWARILGNWWLEIGACILFTAALMAITATLYPHQNKPLPQWPYSISVNALLSLYVVVLKASIALVAAEGLGQLKWTWFKNERPLEDLVKYDEASRGPLGALKLLWRLRARQPLSSCGALIIVVLIAVDPFAQQLLRYRDCNIAMDGMHASLPRTNFYLGHGMHDGPLQETITPPLQAAINAGIFSPGTPVASKCLTGNCTFPQEYSTLGWCSRCEEVTHRLEFEEGILNGTEFPTVTTSLPSGLSMFACWNSGGDTFATMSCSVRWSGGLKTTPVEIIVGKRASNLDPSTGAPPLGCNNGATNDTWHCNGYGASSCVLYPCVRSYSATIDVGILNETWRSDSSDNDWGESEAFLLATVDTKCLSNQERRSLRDAGYVIDPDTRWLAYNLTFDPRSEHRPPNTSFPESLLAHGCVYIVDVPLDSSLWEEYFHYFLNGTLWGQIGQAQTVVSFSGPQVLETIYNYGDVDFERIDSVFQNISNSMTTFIRQNGEANSSSPALGLVLHSQTCLEVRWGWIAFPAALVLLALIFLLFMVIDTRPIRNTTYIWKSSPLALIFHGLEHPNEHQESQADVNDIRGMRSLARGVLVRLSMSEKGVNLVNAPSERIKRN